MGKDNESKRFIDKNNKISDEKLVFLKLFQMSLKME